MSRTYRKPHLYPYDGMRYYYRLYLRDLIIGHVLHDSIDDVREAFRKVGNPRSSKTYYCHVPPDSQKIGCGMIGPVCHRGSPEYNTFWNEISRVNGIQNLHAHVFRNRSSYRQRINGIRKTKQLDRKKERAALKRDLKDRLDEFT